MRNQTSKVFLSLLLAAVMIPAFAGVFCHCAEASPVQKGIQNQPCHGCCPGMNRASECQTGLFQGEKSSLDFQKVEVSNGSKALSLEAAQDITIDRRAIVPAADEPSPGFTQPLYLSLQILRI